MSANQLMALHAPYEPSEAQSKESLLSLKTQINLCCPVPFTFPFVLLPL